MYVSRTTSKRVDFDKNLYKKDDIVSILANLPLFEDCNRKSCY